MTDLTDRQEEYVAAVSELSSPTAADVANHLNVARSTVRDQFSKIDIVGHTRGKGYYLLADQSVQSATNPFQEEIDKDLIDDLRNGGLTYTDLEKEHDYTKDEAETLFERLEERGYSVDFREIGSHNTRLWYLENETEKQFAAGSGDGVYKFGLISDTHLGSSEEHLTELRDFYDRLEERGIETVFHAGDISDGWKVYKHHHQQLKDGAIGWDALRGYVVDNYPSRQSIDTYFITGNHDYKLWKRSGIYFGQEIDERRDDLNWLGSMEADIVFHPGAGINLELIHPSGGTPYTLGYRAQTLYRERPPKNRPTLAGIGHLHGRMQANAEGVEAFYTGCWQGPTPYVKRKGLPTEIGGWIVELEIESGELRKIGTDWVNYETRDSGNSYDTTSLHEL